MIEDDFTRAASWFGYRSGPGVLYHITRENGQFLIGRLMLGPNALDRAVPAP